MKIITAKTKFRNYSIYIEKGLLKRAPMLVKSIFSDKLKAALVTNDKIFSIYKKDIKNFLDATGFKNKIIIIKDGEEQKNLENTQYIYQNLLDFNFHRNDIVIAFGGGVIGDLAGFAASTFHRGTILLQIPTTIIAQTDSSIGGKAVVNYKGIKNIIGSFYQPHAIIIDPLLLETLEEKEIINGFAEIVKYGVVFDKKILSSLEELAKDSSDKNVFVSNKEQGKSINNISFKILKNKKFTDIIYTCCRIKARIVQKDEFDTGYRNLLNFGHTIGHAIEKVANLKSISHGMAVAIGMIVATDISIELGIANVSLRNKLLEIYKPLKLPHIIPQIDVNELLSSLKFDKKFSSTENKFILLKDLNKPIFGYNIEENIIKKSILKNMPTEKLNEKSFNN